MTTDECKILIAIFLKDFYRMKLDSDTLNTWATILHQFDEDIIQEAFILHMKNHKTFRPVLAGIYGYCIDVYESINGGKYDKYR